MHDTRPFGISHPWVIYENDEDTPVRFSNPRTAARTVVFIGRNAHAVYAGTGFAMSYVECQELVSKLSTEEIAI
jgi:hypothetical protein